MATKKNSKRTPKKGGSPTIMMGCCSMAVDIVFVNDPNFKALVGDTPVSAPYVRIEHPSKSFSILGLAEAGVNKGTTPWQIYVVPGTDPMPLTSGPIRPPKPAKKK